MDGAGSDAVTVAMIGSAGLVLVALVGGVFGILGRRPDQPKGGIDPLWRRLVDDQRRDLARTRADLERTEAELAAALATINDLRRKRPR